MTQKSLARRITTGALVMHQQAPCPDSG